MTIITFQDGKPVLIGGEVSTKKECCCDFEMPTTLTLTLSETPEIYFRRRARTEPTGPFGNDGLWLWPSSAAVLAKCGKSFTPMLDVLQTRGSVGEGPYVRAINDLTDFVPGGMPLQDQTIELTLVEQQPGQSYTYRGHAIRPPTNLTGPPPGQGLNDGCIDCGGTDGYNLTPLPANAGDTVLSFSEPIRPLDSLSGWLRVKGVEYPYANATPGGYSLSLMTPLTESISGIDAVTILTELVEVQLVKRCAVGVPVSVCISEPTKGSVLIRATATATITDGSVTVATVTNGGDGYAKANAGYVEPTGYVSITDESGSGAALSVSFYRPAFEWGVQSVAVINRGSGYSASASAVFVPTNGTYAPFNLLPTLAVSVGEDGGIDGVSVDYHGALLREGVTSVESDLPVVSFCAMSGDGATASAVVDTDSSSPTFGKITGINITSAGSGYSDEPKNLEWWSCSVAFPTGVSRLFSLGYEHASRLLDLATGYDCCAAVEQCRLDDDQRLAPCPKPLLSRVYDMALPFEASNAVPDPLTGGVKFNYSWYHCGGSRGVGGVQNCDLGTINGCKEETLPTQFATPLTVVYSPLTGIKCKLTPGPAEDCDTAWLEPLCDGSCPGDSTLMASLVSLEITSDCQSASGATGTVTIGCIPELKDGVILSASVTNGGSGYAQITLTEPTLSLSAPGGTGGVLNVTKYTPFGEWFRIDSVAVADGGSGYTDNSQVIITLGENDEAFPQQATPDIRIRTMRPPNDEWTMQQYDTNTWEPIPTVGTGLVISLTLAPTYEGSPVYAASSVAVVAGGSGYSVGEWFYVEAVESGVETEESVYGAELLITAVGSGGEVTGIEIQQGGQFAGIDTGVIHSIEFGSWRGAYRKRVGQACSVTVAITQQPPSNGSGAIINAVVQTDPTKNGFGTITGLTVVNGGENYVARCCGNPLP